MKLQSSKSKNLGKWYRLFCAILAITLLGLMVPHGINAVAMPNTADNNAKEVNADTFWHDSKVYVDTDEGARPEGFSAWKIEAYHGGVLDPDYSGTFTETSYTSEQIIPTNATVGVDKDFRLHETHKDPVDGKTWDVYVQAVAKQGYEDYAWYVDYPDGTYKALPDDVDATDPNAFVIDDSIFQEYPINFCCEFTGIIPCDLTAGEGHKLFHYVDYIDGKIVDEKDITGKVEGSYFYEETNFSVDEKGVLVSTFYDKIDGYTEVDYTTAVPKDGYTLKSWTINGKEYPVGKAADILTTKYQQDTVVVKANYQPATQTAKTGDSLGLLFIIIGVIAVAGACGAFAFRKFHK